MIQLFPPPKPSPRKPKGLDQNEPPVSTAEIVANEVNCQNGSQPTTAEAIAKETGVSPATGEGAAHERHIGGGGAGAHFSDNFSDNFSDTFGHFDAL